MFQPKPGPAHRLPWAARVGGRYRLVAILPYSTSNGWCPLCGWGADHYDLGAIYVYCDCKEQPGAPDPHALYAAATARAEVRAATPLPAGATVLPNITGGVTVVVDDTPPPAKSAKSRRRKAGTPRA